jgi:hypothetical protein
MPKKKAKDPMQTPTETPVPAEVEETISRLAEAFRDFLVLLVRLAGDGA